MLPKYFLGTAVLFGLSFLAAVYFFAPGTAQWTGAVDTDWNNPANWVASSGTPSLPPSGGSIGDFVVIPDVSGTTNRFPQVNNAVVASARSLTVQSGAKVTVNLGGSLNVIGSDYDGVTNYGMITNNGLMYIDSAYNDGLVNLTGSTFTNGGTFTVINGLGNRVENYSNLTNTGTFNVFMGVDTNLINHSGAMIHNDGGTFTVSGGLSARVANRGTIESQATLNIDGATMGVCLLNFSGGRIDIQGGTCSIGSGTDARVLNYGSIENHGTFSINGALNGMGLINYATGNVMTDGDFYVSGGNDQRVANYGTFHNNGALTVSGASSGIGWGNYAGSLMENGVMSSVNISGGNNSQIDNYSQITTSNSFSLSGAGTPNPTMYNHAAGTFDVLGGTVAINYGNATHLVNEGIVNNHGTSMNLNYCAASGLINQPNAVFNHFAGTLEARSMMQDRVINHGILNLYSDAYFTSGLGMNLVNSNTGTVRQKGGILGLENFFGNCFQNDGSFYGSPGTQMYLRYGSGDGLNNNGIFVDSAACQITMEALGNTAINNAGYLQVNCDFIYGGFASYVLNNSDTAIIGPMASFTPSPSYNISRAINNTGYFENGGDWILPPNGYTIVDNSGHAWFTSSSSFTGSHLAYIYPILNNNGLFENDGQFIFRQFDAPLVNNSSLFINRGRLNSSFFANTYQGMVNSDTLINQGTLDLDTINTNGLFNQGVFINDTTGRYVADYIGQNGIQNEIGGVIKNHGEITIGGTLGVGNFAINNHGDVDNCNLMDLGGQGLLVGGGILTGSSFNNRSFGQILINNADSGIISNTDFLNEQCAVIQSLGIIRDNGNFINQGFILKNLDTNSVASNVSVNDGLIVNDDPDPFNVGSGNGFLTNGSYTPPTGSLYNIRTNGEEYSVVCQDRINVSLGSNCQVEITPGMLLTGNPICPDYFQVSLTYPAGTTKYNPANMVDASHRGLELTYNVIDPSTNNRCWGTIVVEDKFPPQILCTNDTISCFFMGQREDLVQVTENCDLYPTRTEVLEKQWTDLGCDDRALVGYLARKVRATDVWGHFSECRDTLFVLKETIDSLVCGLDTAIECNLVEQLPNGTWVDVLWNTGKDGSTYVDDQGYAHPWPTDDSGLFPAPYLKQVDPDEPNAYLIPIRTDAGPDFSNSGKCQIVFDYEDHVIPTCGKAYKIRRTWHVYDWCGKSDTTCVQWFIVEDHQPPRVMSTMLEDARIYYPEIINFDKLNLSPFVFPASKNIYVSVDPHDCKAGVQLPDVREFVERSVGQYTFYECDDELELYYEVSYNDPTHPGKLINLQGNYDQDGGHLYLPEGWYTILWTIRDRCWNEFRIWQIVYVIDGTPPTPVCDEITQVSLDPEKCWARIYAKDLDDGSHDNCCQQLHFAVANMDSINYWRDYWHSQFENCLDPYDFHHYYQDIEAAIEEWINIFVFDDYIDVTECGSEQLVLRVYEACDLPEYDPHTFYGGEHEWYWWNLSEQFYAWYIYRLNDYIHYGDPRPELLCEIVERPELISRLKSMISDPPAKLDATPGMSSILSIRWDVPISSNIFCGDDFHDHETYPSPICGLFYQNQDVYNEWYSRVVKPYSTEFTTSANLAFYKRWAFPHLYNDCMIEVLKDDKVPPVVQAPEDITVYCDGVPYWWELTKPYAGGTKTATVTGHGAQYTHDVCWNEDYLTSYCSDPYVSVIEAPSGTAALDNSNLSCCVEIPWDGGDYGYYGGPVCGEYGNYGDGLNCDGYSSWYSEHNWQPIYCRLWLMLDKYDNPDGGHPDPQRYFEETAEDWVITDNCWAPDTDVTISGSLNECGVGTLTKTVTATDKCGNTSHDTQTLYVKPRSDFEVIFPEDVVVNCTDQANLAADHSGAGYPEISDDDCELIGVTYSDERYDVTEGCYKILRTWKLIDWCVYSPDIHHRYPDVIVDDRLVASAARCCIHRNLKDDGDGYMTYLQVIKVVDDEAPVIVCNELDETCIYDDNCDAATVNYELLSSGTDNCANPEEIQYRYTVLANETTPVAYGQGHVLNEDLAVGDYGVWLVGKDRCGNEDSCYTTFTIRDCKKPTPYCYDGISTVVMSPSGEVEVWASDFDAGSYDNCTLSENLILSFTEDGETRSWTYTCADIPDGRSQEIQVTIWVIDAAGNKDFCTTTFILQDNTGNACTDNSPLTESGVGKANPGQKEKGERIKTPELYQNTPNPFSGETMIGFWLPESTQATLRVMDVTGKELYRVSGSYSAGNHQLTLEAGSLPDMKGVLFYQLETKSGVINKRMVKVN